MTSTLHSFHAVYMAAGSLYQPLIPWFKKEACSGNWPVSKDASVGKCPLLNIHCPSTLPCHQGHHQGAIDQVNTLLHDALSTTNKVIRSFVVRLIRGSQYF